MVVAAGTPDTAMLLYHRGLQRKGLHEREGSVGCVDSHPIRDDVLPGLCWPSGEIRRLTLS